MISTNTFRFGGVDEHEVLNIAVPADSEVVCEHLDQRIVVAGVDTPTTVIDIPTGTLPTHITLRILHQDIADSQARPCLRVDLQNKRVVNRHLERHRLFVWVTEFSDTHHKRVELLHHI